MFPDIPAELAALLDAYAIPARLALPALAAVRARSVTEIALTPAGVDLVVGSSAASAAWHFAEWARYAGADPHQIDRFRRTARHFAGSRMLLRQSWTVPAVPPELFVECRADPVPLAAWLGRLGIPPAQTGLLRDAVTPDGTIHGVGFLAAGIVARTMGTIDLAAAGLDPAVLAAGVGGLLPRLGLVRTTLAGTRLTRGGKLVWTSVPWRDLPDVAAMRPALAAASALGYRVATRLELDVGDGESPTWRVVVDRLGWASARDFRG